jgi:hypothetical protein
MIWKESPYHNFLCIRKFRSDYITSFRAEELRVLQVPVP